MNPRIVEDRFGNWWIEAEHRLGGKIRVRAGSIEAVIADKRDDQCSIETSSCYYDLAEPPDAIWALLEKPPAHRGAS